MDLKKIDTLLLQEMEDVKGGIVGTCVCDSAAGQGPGTDGTCSCKSGAGQQSGTPNPGGPTCLCSQGGGANQVGS